MFGKRIQGVLVAVAASITLAACGGSGKPNTAKTGTTKTGPSVPNRGRALSEAEVGPSNLKLGQKKAQVHAAFGTPAETMVRTGPGSPTLPCDVYRLQAPASPPNARFVQLCYKRDRIATLSMPIDPTVPTLPPPAKENGKG